MPSSKSAVISIQLRGLRERFVPGHVFRRAQRGVLPILHLGARNSILILRFRNRRRPLA